MKEYIYSREKTDGKYDIENQERVDGEGEQIHLAKEIEAAFSCGCFRVICNGAECKVMFKIDPTEDQKSLLDGIVLAHKNNT